MGRKKEINHWSGGQLLAYSGLDGHTDFEKSLVLRTGFDGLSLNIVYPVKAIIRLNSRPETCRLGSDWLELVSGKDRFSLVFCDSCNVLFEGHGRIELEDTALTVLEKDDRSLLAVKGRENRDFLSADLNALCIKRREWVSRKLPLLENLPEPAYSAGLKALNQLKGMIYAPEGRIGHYWSTPDRWPHRRMWLWDSVFHAAGMRNVDLNLARHMISAVFDCQREDGFIPHMMTPQSSSDITQPPILGFGMFLIHEMNPRDPQTLDWIDHHYEPLRRYLFWIENNRDTDGDGLVEWFIEAHENCRSGESGMDNSIRFDKALQLGAVDFNCFLSREYGLMKHFADLLGKKEESIEWEFKKRKLNSLINRLCWDEKKGFYYDYNGRECSHSPVESVSGFLPLICGAAEGIRAERLLEALNDPDRFGADLPIPSISLSDPEHTDDMWRGPAWINMNWIIIKALRERGYEDESEQLKKKTLRILETMVEKYGTFFEYYDCRDEKDPPLLKRKGKCAPEISPYNQVFFDYGWSACLYLDLILNT